MSSSFEFPEFFEYPPYFTCVPCRGVPRDVPHPHLGPAKAKAISWSSNALQSRSLDIHALTLTSSRSSHDSPHQGPTQPRHATQTNRALEVAYTGVRGRGGVGPWWGESCDDREEVSVTCVPCRGVPRDVPHPHLGPAKAKAISWSSNALQSRSLDIHALTLTSSRSSHDSPHQGPTQPRHATQTNRALEVAYTGVRGRGGTDTTRDDVAF